MGFEKTLTTISVIIGIIIGLITIFEKVSKYELWNRLENYLLLPSITCLMNTFVAITYLFNPEMAKSYFLISIWMVPLMVIVFAIIFLFMNMADKSSEKKQFKDDIGFKHIIVLFFFSILLTYLAIEYTFSVVVISIIGTITLFFRKRSNA